MKKIPRDAQKRVDHDIFALAHDPRPSGVKALLGDMSGLYRVMVGYYRIVYMVEDKQVVVCMVRVRHRKEVYRSPTCTMA